MQYWQAPQVQLCGLYRSAYIIGLQDLDATEKRSEGYASSNAL